MPKQDLTPVERGPGSISPTFTAPSVSVAQPGLGAQPQQTEAEQFRDAILAFGRGVGAAVSARAAINARMKALKEQAVNKVDADLHTAARAFTVRRLEKADAERRKLLSQAEAGDISMESLESKLRSRMSNAFSAEEGRIWEGSWNAARNALKQERAEEKQQAFNRAKMTMREVATQIGAEIDEDPALKAKLKGNGTNISARVQNYMLEVLQQEADLDALESEDAELLIHQAVMQSAAIADSLRGEWQKDLEDANQRNASRQLEADLYSTATDSQDPARLRTQIEETLTDKLGHLTPEQQSSIVRDHVRATLNGLAAGEFGLDNFNLDSALSMVDLTVNGEKVFTGPERTKLAAELHAQAERTLTSTLEGRVAALRESYNETVMLPDGTQVSVPALDADMRLTDRTSGASPLDLLADDLLTEVVGEKEGPEADRLRGIVRDAQRQIMGRVSSAGAKWHGEMVNTSNYYSGGTVESQAQKNRAYHHSPEARALRSPSELAAAGNRPPSKPEVDHLRAQYVRIAQAMGMDPTPAKEWDGSTIGTDSPLRTLAEAHHANLHNQRGEVPPAAVEDKMALLRSNSTEDFAAFASFVNTLDGGPDSPFQSFMAVEGLSDSERAALIHIRSSLKLGAVSWSPDGAPIFQSPRSDAVDMEQLRAQAQAIRSAPHQRDWLWNRSSDERGAPANVTLLATAMTEAIRGQDDPGRYSQAEWEQGTADMATAIQRALTSNSQLAQFVSSVAQSQSALEAGLGPEGQAAVILGWMDRSGHRFKQVNGTVALVVDPHNYTGAGGEDVDAHAQRALTQRFAPWYRLALAEALGVDPGKAPQNLQELHMMDREGVVRSGGLLPDATRPLTRTEAAAETPILTAFHGSNFADNQLRLLPTERGGGSPIYVQTAEGVLSTPAAKHDVTVTGPGGIEVTFAAGQALNVYNPAHFVPLPRQAPRSANGFTQRPAPQPFDYQSAARPVQQVIDVNRPKP